MMANIKSFIIPGLVAILLVLIFGRWFTPGILSGGDWPYLFPAAVAEVVPLSAWDTLFNNGIGMSALPKIWFDAYSLTIVKIANLLSWPIFERLIWFFPYVLVSFFAAFLLSKKFIEDRNFNLLSGVIYTANSYSLLVVSGGQAGVFTAYAFLPLVFLALLNLFDRTDLKRSIVFSLALSLILMLDLRVGYMFLAGGSVLGLVYLIYNHKDLIAKLLYFVVVPGVVAFLLHFFWILPIILMGRNPASQLTDIYTSSASLSFFSFAKLENTIGLLHPNWPENLFGKVAFLRPEFLIVAILAFGSLLFASSEQKNNKISILSIVLLGILGIFLAKGTNDPMGFVYEFFFNTIPGFVMFRDPTKWYMLIAVAFAILIPYSLKQIANRVSSIRYPVSSDKYSILNTRYSILISVIFIIFWAFLIRDSYNGVLKGTLYPRQIPANYQKFASVLANDKGFSRTLWVPVYPSLAYVSNTHPAIPAVEFFTATSTADLINILKKPETEQILVDSSVKYVVVPDDIYGRIFLTDRKYDENVYEKTLEEVSKVDYLKPVAGYGKMGVFEVNPPAGGPKGHFWGIGKNISVTTKYFSPTAYDVTVKNFQEGDKLIFAESYDKFWKAKTSEYPVSSIQYPVSKNQILNSFILPKTGSYVVKVYYQPQEWLNMGLVVSGISLAVVVYVLFKVRKR